MKIKPHKLICGLCALSLAFSGLCLWNIYQLRGELERQTHQLMNLENLSGQVSDTVRSVPSLVRSALDEAFAVFSKYESSFSDTLTPQGTGEIQVQLIPRQWAQDTTVQVLYQEDDGPQQSVQAQRSGEGYEYTASIPFSISADKISLTGSTVSQGVTSLQPLEDFYAPKSYYTQSLGFPELFGSTQYQNGSLKTDWEVSLHCDGGQLWDEKEPPLVSCDLVMELDGEEIDRLPLEADSSVFPPRDYSLKVQKEYACQPGQRLTVKMVAQDPIGFTYEQTADSYQIQSNGVDPDFDRYSYDWEITWKGAAS